MERESSERLHGCDLGDRSRWRLPGTGMILLVLRVMRDALCVDFQTSWQKRMGDLAANILHDAKMKNRCLLESLLGASCDAKGSLRESIYLGIFSYLKSKFQSRENDA
jgi:hypothetical protein